MVKNTQGGSKHKGLARKLVNAPISAKPRLSECDDECYALVTKMLGNGMCHVNLSHKGNIIQNVVCHIRGKFRGRNKKNNIVATGNFVLVGLRTWENPIKNCDIIFTFIDLHIPNIPFDIQSLNLDDHIDLASKLDICYSSNSNSISNHSYDSYHSYDSNIDIDII
jgi:translation initiation factor IF-1